MKDKINELKIFYHGINNDISEINNICEVCTQKNLKFYKRAPCKQLLFIKPKDKLVVDLTYLPLTLIKNTEFKYLLNCIDHFSKYVVSFLLKTKKAREMVESFIEVFGEDVNNHDKIDYFRFGDCYGYVANSFWYHIITFSFSEIVKLYDNVMGEGAFQKFCNNLKNSNFTELSVDIEKFRKIGKVA